MDAFSLILGSFCGGLVGWAFASAASKQREASTKSSKASQAKEKLVEIEEEAKNDQDSSFSDVVQSFLLRLLGFAIIFILGMIFFNSLS
jgi:membrane protein YqaA with SNARE-associated domain